MSQTESKTDKDATIASKLSEIEKQGRQPWILRTFFKADKDKDRQLSKEECIPIMSQLGLSNYQDAIFAMMDEDSNGLISLYEFLFTMNKILDLKMEKVEWLSGVFNIFRLYDVNISKDGKITKEEFNKAFENNYRTIEERDNIWNEMTKFDENNDGTLSFPEFVKYYESINVNLGKAHSNKYQKNKNVNQQSSKNKNNNDNTNDTSTNTNDTNNSNKNMKKPNMHTNPKPPYAQNNKNNKNSNDNSSESKDKDYYSDNNKDDEKKSEIIENKISAFSHRAWIMSQFFAADKNKDRMLDKKECESVLIKLGFGNYLQSMFELLDQNGDNKISMIEFVNGIEIGMKMKEKDLKWLENVFNVFEQNGVNVENGKITKEEFKNTIKISNNNNGDNVDADTIWKQIAIFNGSGNGSNNNDDSITFGQFAKFYATVKIEQFEQQKAKQKDKEKHNAKQKK